MREGKSFEPRKSKGTRVETRHMLRRLMVGKSSLDQLSKQKLHSTEVAAYTATQVRTLWIASKSAGLFKIAKHLEETFYEACSAAEGEVDPQTFKTHLGNLDLS
jgi:hypothetical protein